MSELVKKMVSYCMLVDNRKISYSFKIQQYPDHPERFDQLNYIMCSEDLYGRCYWEDECRGEDWAVAVCYK